MKKIPNRVMTMEPHTRFPEGEGPIMEVVWKNIERYRIEKNVRVSHLCRRTDYASSQYYGTKNKKGQLKPSQIQKFAKILGVKTLDLFED